MRYDNQPSEQEIKTQLDTTPEVTGNILMHYKVHQTGMYVTHKEVTNDNCNRLNASKKALHTVARLFEGGATPIGKILSLFSTTRKDINKLGLRPTTGGVLVRASFLSRAQALFDEADDQLERLRGEVRRQYPELVQRSRTNLGDAADSIEFPTAEETAAKFRHTLFLAPDPTGLSGALLDGVSEEVAAKVRASQQTMLEDAHSNLIKELLGFLTGTGDSDPGIIGVLGSDCVLKKSRFENLKARLDEAKSLNYLDLPAVDKAINILKPIAEADLGAARGDDHARRQLEVAAKQAVASVTKDSLSAIGLAVS